MIDALEAIRELLVAGDVLLLFILAMLMVKL